MSVEELYILYVWGPKRILACHWSPQFYSRCCIGSVVIVEVSSRRIRTRVRTETKLPIMNVEMACNELGGQSLVVELGSDTGIAGIVDVVNEIPLGLVNLKIPRS
jgi:hypothetical protein